MKRFVPLLMLVLLLLPALGRADGDRAAPWSDAWAERASSRDDVGFSTVTTAATASRSGAIHLAISAERTSPVGYLLMTDRAFARGFVSLGTFSTTTGQIEITAHVVIDVSVSAAVQSIGSASVTVTPNANACSLSRGCFVWAADNLTGARVDDVPGMDGATLTGSQDVVVVVGGSCEPGDMEVQFGFDVTTAVSGEARAAATADMTVDSISWRELPCA